MKGYKMTDAYYTEKEETIKRYNKRFNKQLTLFASINLFGILTLLGYLMGNTLKYKDNQEVKEYRDAKTTLRILEERLPYRIDPPFTTPEIQSYHEHLKEAKASEEYSRLEDAISSVEERIEAMEDSQTIIGYNKFNKNIFLGALGIIGMIPLSSTGLIYLSMRDFKKKRAELLKILGNN